MKTLRETIEEIIKDNSMYVSSDQVVEEKGLLWRIKPKFAKEKANVILSAFKQAMPPAKKPSKKVTTGLSGEELLTYMEETPKEYGWNAYRKEVLKIVGDSPHRKI